MGKVSNLIKIIIKAAVNNTSEGELSKDLINTLVDGVSDKGLNEINDFINGSKYKIANYNVPYKVDTTRKRDCLKCWLPLGEII